MAEPRARLRQKGQQFPTSDIEAMLIAFGDHEPLPSSVTVLDEIITDFIIETCHTAALSASYSRRQKIKVDDFKWVLRRDTKKLGRVTEISFAEKVLKEQRRAFQIEDASMLVGKRKGGELVAAGAGGDADGDDVGAGAGAGAGAGGAKRGRKKRKVEDK